MSVFKRGKVWVVQFNYNNKTYTKSSRSTGKHDAQELERQMRQQLVETKVLGHRAHIRLYEACDELLAVTKEPGVLGTLVTATNRFKAYFDDIALDEITDRSLLRWVEFERKRGIQDITIRLWARQFNMICRSAKWLGYYTPNYEWGEWHLKDQPIRYLTDAEEQQILRELDPSQIKSRTHRAARQSVRDLFIAMIDAGFRINEASTLK
jgi:hypothetical protein